MVDNQLNTKQDEQYPLLKTEVAPEDAVRTTPAPVAVVAPGWKTSNRTKHTLINRWPEFLSACWLTIILLGISFLVFYLVGMSAYKRQPVIIFKDTASERPASYVFFHQIIPKGSYVPFMIYADYLSTLAQQYPSLRFQITFLKEDSQPHNVRGLGNHGFFKILMSYNSIVEYTSRLEEDNKRMMRDFQRRYRNVNINITSLNSYMSSTPFKYLWTAIPRTTLQFYARVSSIWQYGGIGLDLETYNYQYLNNGHLDKRISAIFKQHNDGINADQYGDILNTISDNDNSFENMFTFLLDSIINHSQSIFNYTFSLPEKTPVKNQSIETNVRTHRSKRDSANHLNLEKSKSEIKNSTIVITQNEKLNERLQEPNNTNDATTVFTTESNNELEQNHTTVAVVHRKNDSKKDKHSVPKVLFFYDFSIVSNEIGPSYSFNPESSSDNLKRSAGVSSHQRKSIGQNLTIDPEGRFIAASSRFHPFLEQLVSTVNLKATPRNLIKSVFDYQCNGNFKIDNYCNHIFLI